MERPGLQQLQVFDTRDDAVQTLKVVWYVRDPVYRVSCIGDSSCFFHALLKGTNSTYLQTNSIPLRSQQVRNYRNQLADKLQQPDPNAPVSDNPTSPALTFWDTAAEGRYREYQQLQEQGRQHGEDPFDDFDYSLKGLQMLLRSNSYIGDELYAYASEDAKVNIHVLFGYPDQGALPYVSTGFDHPDNIFILAVGGPGQQRHYELLSVYRNSDGRPLASVPAGEQQPIHAFRFGMYDPLVIAFQSLEIYQRISASLKTMYDKYAALQQRGVTDQGVYSNLREMIEGGKRIYQAAYLNMLSATAGDTTVDNVSALRRNEQDINVLRDRAVAAASIYLN